MPALPWPYLALLTLGYCLALSYGQLGIQAIAPLLALVITGIAAYPQRARRSTNQKPLPALCRAHTVCSAGCRAGPALATRFPQR